MKTFIISYRIIFKDNSFLSDKEMKVKNCLSSLQAQCKLEDHLKKKYPNFERLIITNCIEDVLGQFGDIFGDIFENKSPLLNINQWKK